MLYIADRVEDQQAPEPAMERDFLQDERGEQMADFFEYLNSFQCQAKMPPLLLENIFIALLLASINPTCTHCGTVSNPLRCILLAAVIAKVEFANNLKAGDCGIGIIAA